MRLTVRSGLLTSEVPLEDSPVHTGQRRHFGEHGVARQFLTAQIRDYLEDEMTGRGLDPEDPVDVAVVLEEMFGDALG
jgi:hypothetical protein